MILQKLFISYYIRLSFITYIIMRYITNIFFYIISTNFHLAFILIFHRHKYYL